VFFLRSCFVYFAATMKWKIAGHRTIWIRR
jgi:hypothetical protein